MAYLASIERDVADAKGVRTADQPRRASPLRVLQNRNFLLLWAGEGISVLGDQFYLIALPWLVLQLTGNGLAVGTVLAAAGIPRALFMLVGGALTDRFSSRALMLGSNILRMILVGTLAGLVLTGSVELWMLYAFSLLFGLVDAFFYPAQSSIVPQLVDGNNLQAGNALVQGTAQMSLFVGPVIAGTLIALLDGGNAQLTSGAETVPSQTGLGITFAIDALTFLVSAVTLSFIRIKTTGCGPETGNNESMLASIREGLASVWNDAPLRAFFFVIATSNLLVTGPVTVGIPVLADSRLPEGAAAFGIVMSAYGAGSLIGIALAGLLPRPAENRMGSRLLAVSAPLGLGLALLGITSFTAGAALINLLIGIAQGYVVILFMTWLQSRTPQTMLGRMMSLLMFAAVGTSPLSLAGAGVIVDHSLTALFVGSGCLTTFVILIAALNPTIRSLGPKAVVAD